MVQGQPPSFAGGRGNSRVLRLALPRKTQSSMSLSRQRRQPQSADSSSFRLVCEARHLGRPKVLIPQGKPLRLREPLSLLWGTLEEDGAFTITAVPLGGEGVESSREVLQALEQTGGREWLELL